MEGKSRDLLRRFLEGSNGRDHQGIVGDEEDEDSEEIELSLGLSLGGRFGKDAPKGEKRGLVRSSSIAGLEMLPRDLDVAPPQGALPLIRTCSLPTETEEEWRKRKEIQSLRRLEAKRKRSEKQKNSRPVVRDRDSDEGLTAAPAALFTSKAKFSSSLVLAPPCRSADIANGKFNVFGCGSLQGSVGSQGSTSSGVSDMDSRSLQGSRNCIEGQKSPSSGQVLECDLTEERVCNASKMQQVAMVGVAAVASPASGGDMERSNSSNGMMMMMMEEMPCVSTKGEGPNGRRVEGFLYKYGKGEEVRIVCVCHGSFLSPAEFVKHAGGGDVAHPLRHIVVNPSSSSTFS